LQVAKAGTVGDIVVVDPAVVPSRPVEPNRPLVVLVGLALGLFLGVGAAFGRRALRQGIEDPEVLDERLGLPVFAVLPHSEMQRRMDRRRAAGQPGTSNLLAAIEKDDQTVEALRSLRTALRLALPNGGKGVICMTSLSPNEGKSFVASNLGYLFAQGGLRVLIVDADLRRGHLHRGFGWTRGRGLSELMRGEISIEEAVRETPLQGLHLMTTGALPADAATLLVHCDIGDLLDRLRASYDLVVMDVPPVLAVSDAYIIARHATVNILLLKHGLHGLGQVRLVLKQFARQGIKVDGSVLNDVSAAAQRYAYRGYGYQYTYRYK
jgi:tyrosine-protein kinase Etk/Wzc